MGNPSSNAPHHRDLVFGPEADGAFRKGLACVRQALADWQLTAPHDDALLIAAELLSNAVKHAGGPTRLSIDHVAGHLRIAVTDPSPTPLHRAHRRPDEDGGRGIFLIDQLAAHWGTRPEEVGKTIWADLPVSAGETGSGRRSRCACWRRTASAT
ncbi:ATP-binding protein [Streptomyces sp. NPDC101118]|uniref:ATP-binding protein n=1 Tax=Streptomyces sp. NPDC101118 TaxID=3366109 RepID=UPI00380130E2